MKEKIINIRNILKIIISLFVIFTMIKSCSKAYTWDDLIEYTEQVYTSGSNTKQWKVADFFKQHKTNIETIVGNYKTTGTSFLIMAGNNDVDRIEIYVWTYNPNINFSTNEIIATNANTQPTWGKRILSNNNTQSTPTRPDLNASISYGLIETSYTIKDTWWLQNKYTPKPALEFVPMGDGDITVDGIEHVQKLRINAYHIGWIKNYGETEIPSKTTWDFYLLNPEQQEINLTDKTDVVYEGQQIYWYIAYDDWVQWHKLYRLRIYFEKELYGTYYYYGINPLTDTDLVDGSIVNYGWTSGDFEYDLQDQTQEQQNFTEKIIDALFKVDSGDVQQVLNGIIENTHIDDMGIFSGEKQILDILTGEPSDFIISWEPAYYEGAVIIPSGEINFSAKIREIPELKSAIDWAHIIIGYATISIVLAEIWFTFCKVLGIATSWYEQQHDEINTMEEYTNDFYDENTQILVRDRVVKRPGYVQTIRSRKDFNPKRRK